MGSRSAWKTCIFKVLWPVATVLLIASPCPSRAALTPSEATCRQRVGSVGRGLLRDLQKAITKCRDRVSKGALPAMTDCSVEPGTASRIAKVEGQVGAKVAAACSDAVVAQLVFGGACYGSATAADLASCLVDTHEEQAFALADVVYGSTGPLPDAQRACQAAVSKQGKKFVVKRHKQITHCKDLVGRGTLAPTTDCGAEAAIVVNRGAANAATKIAAKCPDAIVPTIAFGKPCIGVTTAAALGACTLGQHTDRDDTLIAVEYGSGASGTTALAKQITVPSSECVKGPLSRCRAGDYLLANDQHPRGRPGPAAEPVRHRSVRRPDHRRRPGAHPARPRARQLRGVVHLDQHREHGALHGPADPERRQRRSGRGDPRHRRRRPARLHQPEHRRRGFRIPLPGSSQRHRPAGRGDDGLRPRAGAQLGARRDHGAQHGRRAAQHLLRRVPERLGPGRAVPVGLRLR